MQMRSSTDVEREIYVSNIEETLTRISNHAGVVGVLIVDPSNGSILRFLGFDDSVKAAQNYADKLKGFISLASSSIRIIDWHDRMTFLRLCYGAYDVMVAPDVDKRYNLIVVQFVGE